MTCKWRGTRHAAHARLGTGLKSVGVSSVCARLGTGLKSVGVPSVHARLGTGIFVDALYKRGFRQHACGCTVYVQGLALCTCKAWHWFEICWWSKAYLLTHCTKGASGNMHVVAQCA
eukprot:1161530-Pelagomonas_calceolata.AAC.4